MTIFLIKARLHSSDTSKVWEKLRAIIQARAKAEIAKIEAEAEVVKAEAAAKIAKLKNDSAVLNTEAEAAITKAKETIDDQS